MYDTFEGDGPAKFFPNDSLKGVLSLEVSDIESLNCGGGTLQNDILMDLNHAIQIRNFVETYKNNVDFFIVHCKAGVSRSPAVAFAIREMYLGDNPVRLFGIYQYAPNFHIYKLCMKAFGKDISDKDINELRRINYK
jgi:predicted protein tyrosine phosphatase